LRLPTKTEVLHRIAAPLVREAQGLAALKRNGPAALADQWWYYTVELAPGVVAKGNYEDDFPMLPRMMLRRIKLEGARCLDLGSVEGMIPAVMARGGASRVLATDYSRFCMAKVRAVRAAYDVDFDFKSVGPMDGLYRKISAGFDLINCSGLLYHVWSPLHVLAGVRPLLYRHGLMIVSTNVVLDDGMHAEFNAAGRMQDETNTFWYPTIALLEYQLRYLRLEPVSALLLPHGEIKTRIRYLFDRPSGYLCVLCRAVDTADADPWMARSAAESWEYRSFSHSARANNQPRSAIGKKFSPISLTDADAIERVTSITGPQDTHVFHLGDQS
jgi:2-polyprenyl-3-methyl-5-hydroxy-6-metoxy-1,4-benzoquinol methylase